MDVSGTPAPLPETQVDRLKRELVEIHVAELQHILNHIQKRRDDVLLIVSFVHNYFDMNPENFRLFKEWLQAEGLIDMDAAIRDVLQQATANLSEQSAQCDGPQGCRVEILEDEPEVMIPFPGQAVEPPATSSAVPVDDA